MIDTVYSLMTRFAAAPPACPEQSKFGIPTWYKYLEGSVVNDECKLLPDFDPTKIQSLMGIGLALVEILLFFAGIIAVAYVIYGGFRYVLSQGEPENIKTARNAILNAVIGLAIAVLASTIVRYIGSTLS